MLHMFKKQNKIKSQVFILKVPQYKVKPKDKLENWVIQVSRNLCRKAVTIFLRALDLKWLFQQLLINICLFPE